MARIAGQQPADRRLALLKAAFREVAEKGFSQVTLDDIARRAGVSLSELREAFGSTLAILAVYIKGVDRTVLAGGDADMAEEPPRERLFDVLMRRLETLAPHKAAVRSLMRDFVERARSGESRPDDPLTPREVEIVKLIAEARTTREIAAELVLSEKTVERHRTNILAKLGMRDRVELVRYAIRRGLVEP